MIAAAVSRYIADMWLQYAEKHTEKYPSGTARGILGLQWSVVLPLMPWNMKYRSRRQKSVRRRA